MQPKDGPVEVVVLGIASNLPAEASAADECSELIPSGSGSTNGTKPLNGQSPAARR